MKGYFEYELPSGMIAEHPSERRIDAKLLIYREGNVEDSNMGELSAYIPEGSLLLRNNTKVIPARLLGKVAGGKHIEFLLLYPMAHPEAPNRSLLDVGKTEWCCMVGGQKHWKDKAEPLQVKLNSGLELVVHCIEKQEKNMVVAFEWQGEQNWAMVVEEAGQTPLPPYIKREAHKEDIIRYQTQFAKEPGAVAAPTAGLHFDANMESKLAEKGVEVAELTLHVGAGTFAPIPADAGIEDVQMHSEYFVVHIDTLIKMAQHSGSWVALGTTSLRTLESLLVCAKLSLELSDELIEIKQEMGKQAQEIAMDRQEAMRKLLGEMESKGLSALRGQTQIFIYPEYQVQMADALITNFHQPESTLLLLVQAFVGREGIEKIYQHALANKYRFLSYGDGSILWK